MAFTVEDGSIVAGANAYISINELDAYWGDRNTPLNKTLAQKEAAVVIATQYVDLNNTWKGSIAGSTQALDWPRQDVIDGQGREIAADAIPEQLKSAVAEYAKRQLFAELQPDLLDTGTIKKVKKKVDVIETETEYQDGTGGYFGLKRYPLADNYLRGLTRSGGLGKIGGC